MGTAYPPPTSVLARRFSDVDQDVRLAARSYHGAAVQLRDRPMAITSAGAMWSR